MMVPDRRAVEPRVVGRGTLSLGRAWAIGLMLLVQCSLAFYWGNQLISHRAVRADALHNMQVAYNLARYGEFSDSVRSKRGSETVRTPTMFREPFPIFALAGWLRLNFYDLAEADPNVINGQPPLVALKQINIVWTILTIALSFFAARLLTGSSLAGLLASTACLLTVGLDRYQINNLNTEPIAGALILAASYALARGIMQPRFQWSALAGTLLGATILTKAIILYALPVIVIVLVLLLKWKTQRWGAAFAQGTVLLIVSILVFAPWIARNAYTFGEPHIAGRSGIILYKRMLLDRMPVDSYVASFYVWAPDPVRPTLERLFGFSHADLEQGEPASV